MAMRDFNWGHTLALNVYLTGEASSLVYLGSLTALSEAAATVGAGSTLMIAGQSLHIPTLQGFPCAVGGRGPEGGGGHAGERSGSIEMMQHQLRTDSQGCQAEGHHDPPGLLDLTIPCADADPSTSPDQHQRDHHPGEAQLQHGRQQTHAAICQEETDTCADGQGQHQLSGPVQAATEGGL